MLVCRRRSVCEALDVLTRTVAQAKRLQKRSKKERAAQEEADRNTKDARRLSGALDHCALEVIGGAPPESVAGFGHGPPPPLPALPGPLAESSPQERAVFSKALAGWHKEFARWLATTKGPKMPAAALKPKAGSSGVSATAS